MLQLFFIKDFYFLSRNFKNFMVFEFAQDPAGALPGHSPKVCQIIPANGPSKYPAKVNFIEQVM
jgi:hypothetical protein